MKKHIFWIMIAWMAAGCTLQDGNDLAKECGSSSEPLQFIQLPNDYICYPEGCPDCPMDGDESVLCRHYIFNDAFGQNRCPTKQFECVTEGAYVPYCKILTASQKDEDVCAGFENQCNGNTLKVCANNEFTEIPCDNEGKICAKIGGKATCVDSCSDEDNKCTDGILYVCRDHFLSKEKCVKGEICGIRDGEPACLKGCEINDVILSSGESYCDDSALVSCTDGKLSREECPGGICENDMCTLASCDGVPNGETRCNEGILEKCSNGKFITVPGECSADCITGSKKCDGETKYFVCEDGHWSAESTSCPDNSVCTEQDGDARCKPQSICEDSDIRCDETDETRRTYSRCHDGQWGSEVFSCDEGKYCDENACVPFCVEGMTQCTKDQKVQICQSNGMMGEPQNCERRFSCSGGKCQCTDGARQCGKDNKQEFVQACIGGEWFKGDVCEYGCNDEPDVAVCHLCSNGAFQCTEEGMLQVCKDDQWSDVEDCSKSSSIDAKKSCVANTSRRGCACSQGNTRCSEDGKSVEICTIKNLDPQNKTLTYYGWDKSTDCTDGCITENNKAYCACKNGTASCNGKVLSRCENNIWKENVETCDDTMICDEKQGKCRCEEGAYLCDNHGRRICKNGAWEQDPCGKNQTCDPNEGWVCKNQICQSSNYTFGGLFCAKNDVVRCNNMGGFEVMTCQSNESCQRELDIEYTNYICADKAALQVCFALITPQKCNGDVLQKCTDDHKWITDKDCSKSSQICLENTEKSVTTAKCVDKVCDFKTVRCHGDKIEFCGKNEWLEWADCASVGRKCADGHCVKK
ncbi:MAG: hypothetical protein IJM59_12225 [Proteobacteria bacterium]|nr:hypothetical protein [Pseudomonadota bacterium]